MPTPNWFIRISEEVRSGRRVALVFDGKFLDVELPGSSDRKIIGVYGHGISMRDILEDIKALKKELDIRKNLTTKPRR